MITATQHITALKSAVWARGQLTTVVPMINVSMYAPVSRSEGKSKKRD